MRLIPAQFVKPYIIEDAESIREIRRMALVSAAGFEPATHALKA